MAQAAKTADELVELPRDITARGNHRPHAGLVFGGEGEHHLLAQLRVDIFLGELGKELLRRKSRERSDGPRCHFEAREVERQ